MNTHPRHWRRRLIGVAVLAVALVGFGGQSPVGAKPPHGTRYYLSLGDSLAESAQPIGDLSHGYVEQLHAALSARDPKLTLVKFGCGGESTVSMRFGPQDPTMVLSCPTSSRYPKGSQLAQAVKFLKAHKGKVALVTIDIGANDLQHVDDADNSVFCLFEPSGCDTRVAAMVDNLAVILAQLRAAGPGVPIVAMTPPATTPTEATPAPD